MSRKSVAMFLGYVEIRTKVASVIPMIAGSLYAQAHFKTFNFFNFLLFLASLLCMDMMTTAVNNYFDCRNTKMIHGKGGLEESFGVDEQTGFSIITVLGILSAAFGLALFIRTDVVVLIIGMVSFIVGIMYTYSPLAINRTPYGEIFSGLFMGFVIFYLSFYIHAFGLNLVDITIDFSRITLDLNFEKMLFALGASFPLTTGIANIMLANNICDIEKDKANGRYTFPVAVGVHASLHVFSTLYILGYLALPITVFFGGLHPLAFIVYLSIPIVFRNVGKFKKVQTKKDTFKYSVDNFVLIGILLIASLAISIIIR